MAKLRDGQDSNLGSFGQHVPESFFRNSDFSIASVNTKTFILMLAQKGPRSFISGSPLDLEEKLKNANRTEFHHIIPKKCAKRNEEHEYLASRLTNFCFLSREDNRKLGGDCPSVYASKIQGNVDEVLNSALVPDCVFQDDLETFTNERASLLAKYACDISGTEYNAFAAQIMRTLTSVDIKEMYIPTLKGLFDVEQFQGGLGGEEKKMD